MVEKLSNKHNRSWMDLDLLNNYGKSGLKFEPRFRSKLFLYYMSLQPCDITGTAPDKGVQTHHLIYKSRGNQCSDMITLRLRWDLHDDLTNNRKGDQDAFFAHHKLSYRDVNRIVENHHEKFCAWVEQQLTVVANCKAIVDDMSETAF